MTEVVKCEVCGTAGAWHWTGYNLCAECATEAEAEGEAELAALA